MTCVEYLKNVRHLSPEFNICKIDGRWRVATKVAECHGTWEISPKVKGKQLIAYDSNLPTAINNCASLIIEEIRPYDNFENVVWEIES